MEIAEYIIADAKKMLSEGDIELPKQISVAPGFYLAQRNDSSIVALGLVVYNEVTYKIGVQKR